MRVLFALSLIFAIASAATKTAYLCEVATDVDESLNAPSFRLPGAYSFDDFNAVSFGDYTADTGDVEGRAAIAGNLNLANGGYSFGYELRTTGVSAIDNVLPYSLVVGGDVNWRYYGEVYPLGDNNPYPATKENLLVNGNANIDQAEIAGRVHSGVSTLSADFSAGQSYYIDLQNAFAGMSSNLQMTFQWSAAMLRCSDSSATSWVVNLDDAAIAQLASSTYWVVSNCNNDSQIVFNFKGTQDILMPGGGDIGFFKTERILYNIIGSRTVTFPNSGRGNFLAPQAVLNQPSGVIIGQVIFGSVRATKQINRVDCRPTPPVNPRPCVGFETDCAGLSFTLGSESLNFKEFNAISFGDFRANTGDIEGRLAAKGDVTFGNGYSVGAELITVGNTPDLSQAYSLVVGGDLVWGSGSLHPDATGFPHAGSRVENAFVAGSSHVSDYLADRIVQGSNIDQIFDDAYTCYNGYSQTLAGNSDTVTKDIYWSGLFISCNDANADEYTISINANQFTQFTYTVTDNCNFQARWTINVRGTGTVEISGGSFPAIPGGVVYNIISADKVYVHDTQLNGHLLAPNSQLNQTNGVIVGKVVAGSIVSSLQINKMTTCPESIPVTTNLVALSGASAGTTKIKVAGASQLRVNDVTSVGTIDAIDGDTVTFDTPFTSDISEGTVFGTNTVYSTNGRAYQPNKDTSSASFIGVAVASFVLAALLI